MILFHFSDTPHDRHRVQVRPGSNRAQVGDTELALLAEAPGRFRAVFDGRSERLHAVAHGDVVHVHWRGRAWRIERVDPTRGAAGGAAAGAGASLAPMPGVVVSLQAVPGQRVGEGDPLLVIESMKLQTTIAAACDGTLAELPLGLGQSFQRGAVLARVQPDEARP